MFSGGVRSQAPTFRQTHDELTIRPYNAALTELTSDICNQVGQNRSDLCLFETRTAFDCLLRNKVRKFGDIMDNVGACSHHISNMKTALGDEHT